MPGKRWTPTPGTLDERIVTGEQPRRHKYGAVPTVVDGIRFASKKEAKRYQELKLLEKAGDIRNLSMQPRFALRVRADEAPVTFIVGHYAADFSYEQSYTVNGDLKWRPVVEDVKGFKTPLYRFKKKFVEAQYGIQIREV